MPAADAPDTFLDRRLVRAAAWLAPVCAAPAAVAGYAAAGAAGAVGAVWGVSAVALNGVAAAWISQTGARAQRGIAIGRVLIALPLRLLLLAVAIAIAVLVLDLPAYPVVIAVCAGELCWMVAQSWLVLHSPTFVGPLS